MRNRFLLSFSIFFVLTFSIFAEGGKEITVPADFSSEHIIIIQPNDGNQLSNGGIMKIMRYFELPPEVKERSENMKFVAFDILIDNSKGDRAISNSGFTPPFIIRDSNGFEYNINYMVYDIVKPAFPSSNIDKGDILRGWLTLAVPLSIKLNDLRIRFSAGSQFSESTMVTSGWTTFSSF